MHDPSLFVFDARWSSTRATHATHASNMSDMSDMLGARDARDADESDAAGLLAASLVRGLDHEERHV